MTRLVRAAAVLLVAGLALAGCSSSNDALAEQYRAGSSKGFISGDGTVTTIPQAKRDAPVHFSGPTGDGKTFRSADHTGDVLVVNFWYAGCAPCRIEAKDLENLSEKYSGKKVVFIGVNTHDQAGTAGSFAKEYGVTYPSILDANSGAVQLAFSGSVPPQATPSTLVLDAKGRIAARVLGPISAQPSTLDTLIRDTMAEKP